MKQTRFRSIVNIIWVFLLLTSCFDNKVPAPPTLSFEEQLEIDIETIDDFLDENNIMAQSHESGIRYVIEEEGNGDQPTTTSNITFTYIGSYLNGTIFDQSTQPVSFNISQLIEAFQIGIPLASEGATIILYSPSGYCYGPTGTATIPPNSNLIFEVELISVEK